MKRTIAILLALLLLSTAGCTAAQKDAAATAEPTEAPAAEATEDTAPALVGSYTYTFLGLMGEETMQLDFADGIVTMYLPGNAMIADVYESPYTVNEDESISIVGFVNRDSSSPYTTPGLWDWIDASTGACTVVLDTAAGTFAPLGTGGGAAADAEDDTGSAALLDVAYASNSETQTLDLLLPEGEGPFPLVILLHGGGFKFGDKQMPIVQKMFTLTDAGYAVATVNYRMSDEAVFPAAVADVKAAVRFLRANAAEYDLDAERFAIWGESAGAYLAVMSAVTDDATLTGDVTDNLAVSSSVKVLLDFYGPISFCCMEEDAAALGFACSTNSESSFESAFIGKPIGTLTDEEKAAIDPIAYLSAARPLAVWIQAGDADTSVPYKQSQRLAEACKAVFGEDAVHYELLPDAGHEDDAFYTAENLAALIAFLNAHL